MKKKKKETTATTGFIAACGKCNIPLKVHPVKQCPYLYRPIKSRGRVVGYELTKKEP